MKSRKLTAMALAALLAMTATMYAGCRNSPADDDFAAILSFVSLEYAQSGTGEPYVEESRKLVLPEEGSYLAVLEELRSPGDGVETALREDLAIRGVRSSVFGRTLTVDISSENLTGSSMEEDLIIGQIVRTLILSFPGVASVQFTVDGLLSDTLMGHVNIADSFELRTDVDGAGNTSYTIVEVPCAGFT